MIDRRTAVQNRAGHAAVILAALLLAACQGMDRLEPDAPLGGDAADRGTLLEASGPRLGGGRLTEDIATRWIRQIEAAPGEARLRLADRFLEEYPDAEVISYLHELVGDAHSELGQPRLAADAWERAIETSWPAPDLLGLPLTNLELPYEVGWARYEAGDARLGADWLARTTFIDDRPQLEQGLRFLYAELGAPGDGFEPWLQGRLAELSVRAPDFELPGYQVDTLALSEVDAKLTLLNFWTPT
ncbi:MAG TPA: hypothetical protein VGD06_04945 [Acidobacteriota bacterium]